MSGTTLLVGRYELVGLAGRGGMATVYVARQPELDRLIALKQLALFHAAEPDLAARFLRESRLAGSLSHPNIVTVHDYFVHEGVPYIAMEYLPRGSLRALVGRLSLPQLSRLIADTLDGLAHAQERGVVHRDLKPENLLLTHGGEVKISDFGIAKAIGATTTEELRTATGMTLGTPAYMAPEQAMGGAVDTRTDLYALGAIVFELVSGRPPFQVGPQDTPLALLLKHVNEEPPDLRDLAPDADPRLAQWVLRLLAKDPAQRPDGARAACDELEEVVVAAAGPVWRRSAALPDDGPPPPPAPLPQTSTPETALPVARAAQEPGAALRPATASRRRSHVVTGAAVAAMAVGVAVAALLGRGGGGPSRTALAAPVPACIRRFLAGTAANQALVLGVENRFPRAGLADRPIGLLLGASRTVGAVRFVFHARPTEYYEMQGAIDALTCAAARLRDLTNPGALPDAQPYDDLQVDLSRRPRYLRIGIANGRQLEAAYRLQRPSES